MQQERITNLIERVIEGTANPGERSELAQWAGAVKQASEDLQENHPVDLSALEQAWERFEPREYLPEEKAATILARILQPSEQQQPVTLIRRIRSTVYWTRAAAAVLILLVGSITWFTLHKKQTPTAANNHSTSIAAEIVPPQTVRATLTLSDGSRIALDSAQNGSLASQGSTLITKTDNSRLTYQPSLITTDRPLTYNTITLPRGSRPLRLILSDGTNILLNTASSVRYPVAFTGKERRVTITGEAWFDVAKDPGKPFIVNREGAAEEVRVLGTRFNINAYNDDGLPTVTLQDGSVRLDGTGHSLLLKPGQQARMGAGSIHLVANPDPEEALAWTNGNFQFNSMDMESIMRQIGRWYDVEIGYQGAINKEPFTGIVSRNSNLSQVLKILEGANVHFRIEGKKIIVLP